MEKLYHQLRGLQLNRGVHMLCAPMASKKNNAPSIIISVMTVTPMVSKSVLCRIGSQATYLVEFLIVMEVGQ